MDSIVPVQTNRALVVPVARREISVRLATNDDIPFMDEMQKLHQKQLGFMPAKTFEGKIKLGHVLVAEEVGGRQKAVGGEEAESVLPTAYCLPPTPLGYVISQDKYMGHEDLGIFYQVNVKPVAHRNLIGATLVKAVFDRAAYGCKLFCCWCAQDIQANHFWESLGFVPLAFRSGNRAKARVHIFWQKRIREGDTTTPYWFPSETRGGMMNEARLVLPIPPGTHWSDAKPIILPGAEKQLEAPREKKPRKPVEKKLAVKPTSIALGGFRFGSLPQEKSPAEKPKREKRPKQKNDPKLIAAARELRDRYLESVESGQYLPPEPVGKYDVMRQIEDHGRDAHATVEAKLLAA